VVSFFRRGAFGRVKITSSIDARNKFLRQNPMRLLRQISNRFALVVGCHGPSIEANSNAPRRLVESRSSYVPHAKTQAKQKPKDIAVVSLASTASFVLRVTPVQGT